MHTSWGLLYMVGCLHEDLFTIRLCKGRGGYGHLCGITKKLVIFVVVVVVVVVRSGSLIHSY